MIEHIIYKYLSSDIKLSQILDSDNADSKIYANTDNRPAKPPFIVYYATEPSSKDGEAKILLEQSFTFEYAAKNLKQKNALIERIFYLLHINDTTKINEFIDNEKIKIVSSLSQPSSYYDTFPLETKNAVRGSISFRITFVKLFN